MTEPHPTVRPQPTVTWWTEPIWTGGVDGELRVQRCTRCERWQHPPELACTACGSTDVAYPATDGRGVVYTYTVVHQRFRPEMPVPVIVALVELPSAGGVRLTTNIVGCSPDAVSIGAPVQVAFEDLGDGLWAPVFALAPSAG